tara:strand:- start:843 stop:1076 length:234 start_codon:yes stop_codon:yes gene_type:complete
MSKKKDEMTPLQIIEATKNYLEYCEKNTLFIPNEKLQIVRTITGAIERKLDHKAKEEISFMRSRIMDKLDFDGAEDF